MISYANRPMEAEVNIEKREIKDNITRKDARDSTAQQI